jgi:hypothetical protein
LGTVQRTIKKSQFHCLNVSLLAAKNDFPRRAKLTIIQTRYGRKRALFAVLSDTLRRGLFARLTAYDITDKGKQ